MGGYHDRGTLLALHFKLFFFVQQGFAAAQQQGTAALIRYTVGIVPCTGPRRQYQKAAPWGLPKTLSAFTGLHGKLPTARTSKAILLPLRRGVPLFFHG